MIWSLAAMVTGFVIDCFLGDPHGYPHPVILIGKLISGLEKLFRKLFPKTKGGERAAGGCIWILTCLISFGIPFVILYFAHKISPWFRFALESIMCWQIVAAKSLKDESMKVYEALKTGDLKASRYAVSMIVGRDTERLDDAGVTKAAVETVAENTSDGIVAPLIFMAIGGAPLGFFYKAVNTMDSMLGYIEEPYKNIGLIPAKLDDVMNYIPARISALVMLLSGALLKMDAANGWKIFKRDRYNHASPNSAQTESVTAGLFRIRLAGDAWYHGVLHEKKTIGDDLRPVEHEDIPRTCRLMYLTSVLVLVICALIKAAVILAV